MPLELEAAERAHARERDVAHARVEAAVDLHDRRVERHALRLVDRDRPGGAQRQLQPIAYALPDHLRLQQHRQHDHLAPVVEAHLGQDVRPPPAAAVRERAAARARVVGDPPLQLAPVGLVVAHARHHALARGVVGRRGGGLLAQLLDACQSRPAELDRGRTSSRLGGGPTTPSEPLHSFWSPSSRGRGCEEDDARLLRSTRRSARQSPKKEPLPPHQPPVVPRTPPSPTPVDRPSPRHPLELRPRSRLRC